MAGELAHGYIGDDLAKLIRASALELARYAEHGIGPENEERRRELADAYPMLVDAYTALRGGQAASDWDERCTRRAGSAVNGD